MTASTFSSVEQIVAAITAVREHPVLLLTDFDGTLCEFKDAPDAVILSPPRRLALSALAARPTWSVGIVSGRRAADVRQRAGLSGSAYYAGLHGMEIDGPDKQFQVPDLGALHDEIQRLGNALADATASFPGALLENKDLSVALHVRAASPRDRQHAERSFWTLARPMIEAGTLRLQRGECVFELLPNIAWDKGDAVRWIEADTRHRHGAAAFPIYLGDDRTDEHAFDAVGDRGLTVVVGSRPSRAQYRLPDPAAIERLLTRLATPHAPH